MKTGPIQYTVVKPKSHYCNTESIVVKLKETRKAVLCDHQKSDTYEQLPNFGGIKNMWQPSRADHLKLKPGYKTTRHAQIVQIVKLLSIQHLMRKVK